MKYERLTSFWTMVSRWCWSSLKRINVRNFIMLVINYFWFFLGNQIGLFWWYTNDKTFTVNFFTLGQYVASKNFNLAEKITRATKVTLRIIAFFKIIVVYQKYLITLFERISNKTQIVLLFVSFILIKKPSNLASKESSFLMVYVHEM